MNSHKLKYLSVVVALFVSVQFTSCNAIKNASNSQLGGIIGAAGGAVIGGVIGNNIGDDGGELGAVLGGMIGGAVGGFIGNQMDKQAKKIQEEIPTVHVERVAQDIHIVFDENSGVYFKTNQYSLNESSRETIDKLIAVLQEYPKSNILVAGHTDSVGNENSNYILSKNRAESVAKYIISQGVRKERFTVQWHGEAVPKFDNDTPEGRAKNRRVEVTISPSKELVEEAKTSTRDF
ncbi:OmpA family protein [Aquimarina hainanensis]|uniref:OmpA family protein n=1 Tax=Aquimarina hainanensis TaxID=1578017 RepID=A0ABW5NBX2_9FLAO